LHDFVRYFSVDVKNVPSFSLPTAA